MKDEVFYHLLTLIGNKLTELRKAKGYSSHEDFAHDHDLPRIQYWRLEKGKANFTIFTLMKILAIHDLSMREFFNGVDAVQVKKIRKRRIPEKSDLIINDGNGTEFFNDVRM